MINLYDQYLAVIQLYFHSREKKQDAIPDDESLLSDDQAFEKAA